MMSHKEKVYSHAVYPIVKAEWLLPTTHDYNYFLVSQSRNFGLCVIGRVYRRLIRLERHTTKGNSSEYIMYLVSVFILETHN